MEAMGTTATKMEPIMTRLEEKTARECLRGHAPLIRLNNIISHLSAYVGPVLAPLVTDFLDIRHQWLGKWLNHYAVDVHGKK